MIPRPLVAAIHVKEPDLPALLRSMPSCRLPPNYRVVLHVVKRRERFFSDFPVNLLRNIAIKNVRTTHFLVTDMDLWPSRSGVGGA